MRETPFLLELWRTDPETLVGRHVVLPGGQFVWSPDPARPWTWPPGWPVGYEWRLLDGSGEVERRAVAGGDVTAAYKAPDRET